MLVKEAINFIRQEVNDETNEYPDSQLIRYINAAIQQASMILIGKNSYIMTKTTVLQNGDILPDEFIRFAGNYPLKIDGGIVELLDDVQDLKVKYFAVKKAIQSTDEEIPFKHEVILQFIIEAAAIMAFNHNEFEVSQDNNILAALQNMVGAVCNG